MEKTKDYWYELSVKNFKNIINKIVKYPKGSENGSILFFQSKLNIIVGKNNTGKTNILKAIIYSQNPFDENNDYESYISKIQPKILHLDSDIKNYHSQTEVLLKMPFFKNMKEKIKNPDLKKSVFKYKDLEIEYGRYSNNIENNADRYNLNVYSEKENKKDNLKWIRDKLIEEFKDSDFKITPIVRVITTKKDQSINNNLLDKYSLGSDWHKNTNLLNFLKAFSPNYEKTKNDLGNYLTPTSSDKNENDNDEKNSLKDYILKSINENLKKLFKSKFDTLDYYPEAYIEKSFLCVRIVSCFVYNVDDRDYSNQGTGIRNLLSLVLMLEKNKNDKNFNFLYVIDELEDGLAMSVQEKVINYLYKFIKENKNATIIYTTHSPNLLPINKIDEKANIIIAYKRQKTSNDKKELSGELLTVSIDNISEIDKTGYYIESINKHIKTNTELMKWCLDLNDDIAKKLYESKKQNLSETKKTE